MKRNFFKEYYQNIKELNMSLVIILLMFVVIVAGFTSYALFGDEVVSDYSINLSAGKASTDPLCFDYTSTGFITSYKCYEGNMYGFNVYTDVVIPQYINDVEIIGIDSFVFESKGINSVIIPDSIETIGSYAFNYNNLEEVKIPRSVKKLADGAFYNNKIKEVKIIGKSDLSNFEEFGDDVFGFVPGLDNNSIIFN